MSISSDPWKFSIARNCQSGLGHRPFAGHRHTGNLQCVARSCHIPSDGFHLRSRWFRSLGCQKFETRDSRSVRARSRRSDQGVLVPLLTSTAHTHIALPLHQITLGCKLPADLRLIEISSDLKFDRSILTGESDAIPAAIDSTDSNFLETRNVALQGASLFFDLFCA